MMSVFRRKGWRWLFAFGLLTLPCRAYGWWETWLTTVRPVPLVREIEAEACKGLPADMIQTDPQADGGRGGKAVLLTPGGIGLTTDVQVEPGIYSIVTIARHPEGRVGEWKAGHDLMTLEVKEHKTGEVKSWTMIVVYREEYFAVGQMYFPAYAGGRYTVTVKLATKLQTRPPDAVLRTLTDETGLGLKEPLEPLLVDRLELRDVLGNCARKGAKTQRMLTTDAELEKIRKRFAEDYAKRTNKTLQLGGETFALTPDLALASHSKGRTAAERRERNEKLWNMVPDFNQHYSIWGGNPYGEAAGMAESATRHYENTGNRDLGWDAAVLLCALAEKYPAADSLAQAVGWAQSNISSGSPFRYRNISYDFWGVAPAAYDRVFDFIKGNQDLADYVGTRIPSVKTPQDVIRLLDVNVLQVAMDKNNRSYQVVACEMAEIPLVQGVNEVSDQMLETGLFRKSGIDAAFGGGLDDAAFGTHNRDGIRWIGSSPYSGDDLARYGEYLYIRRMAGGSDRFFLDPKRYPQLFEAPRALQQLCLAGGFYTNYGDAVVTGRLRASVGRRIRSPYLGSLALIGKDRADGGVAVPRFPSRIVGGMGVSILESGQFQEDLDKMRGLALRFGLGRGHAHHDTLGIEFFAHNHCMSRDIGGRHDQGHGRPNMLWNRVHNLVEVDERNFKNDYHASATSATGWNTSFEPMPEAQYMEHRARATSHPYANLYARQTAMIDVGDADSYYFDVFRVRGGKTHTYCFHGCPTNELRINAELKPPRGDAAFYLAEHYPGSQREGKVPDILEVDWPMAERSDTGNMDPAYKDRVPTTRLTMFRNEGADILIGNPYAGGVQMQGGSRHYNNNYPFLHVQWKGEQDGRESVFPVMIEPFAGKPLIVEKRLVRVSPEQKGAEAAVGVEVRRVDGAVDLLYASAKPTEELTVDGKLKGTGKFGVVSRDGEGLRLAALVGGTLLEADEVSLRAEKGAYRPRITAVEYDALNFTVDEELPARLLKGTVANLGGEGILHSFTLTALEAGGGKTKVTHEKTAKYYQSVITHVDEKEGTVRGELEPGVVGCDTEFINGTTVSNESQDKFWKATMKEGDRWMHVGFPGYRGSHMNKVSMEDFPDRNGDGKRTLRLVGLADNHDRERSGMEVRPNDPIQGKITIPDAMELVEIDPPEKVGKTLVELDVTGVRSDGETFNFKLPEDPHYRRGGYQYVGRPLVNEAGAVKWLAFYPGSTFLFKLEGGFRKSDFTDADGDGKVKMAAYVFGPGDRMNVDTYVYARRTSPGAYEVRANVGCEVGLPRGEFNRAEISADGKTFAPIACRADGGRLTIKLAERDLADGVVILRLVKE